MLTEEKLSRNKLHQDSLRGHHSLSIQEVFVRGERDVICCLRNSLSLNVYVLWKK